MSSLFILVKLKHLAWQFQRITYRYSALHVHLALSPPQRLLRSFLGGGGGRRSPLSRMSVGANNVRRLRAGASVKYHTQYGHHLVGGGGGGLINPFREAIK